jgi:hypothetical protein
MVGGLAVEEFPWWHFVVILFPKAARRQAQAYSNAAQHSKIILLRI